MTEFQQRIVEYLRDAPNQSAAIYDIAIRCFPEKWARRQGRGALTGHVRRAGYALEDAGLAVCFHHNHWPYISLSPQLGQEILDAR